MCKPLHVCREMCITVVVEKCKDLIRCIVCLEIEINSGYKLFSSSSTCCSQAPVSPVSSYTVSHLLSNSYTQSTQNFNVYSKNYINRGHFSQLPFMVKTLCFSSHASSPDSGLQCKSFYAQFQVSTVRLQLIK